jgi:hypothetical protein
VSALWTPEDIRRLQEWALREAEVRRAENEAGLRMSLELVAAGYRALVAKYHPDKGGTREDMARLTAARNALKNLLTPASSKQRRPKQTRASEPDMGVMRHLPAKAIIENRQLRNAKQTGIR